MALTILQPQAQFQRKTRNPQHPFAIRQMLFQIQPFLLAPVLPGETLKSGNIEHVVFEPVTDQRILDRICDAPGLDVPRFQRLAR